MIKNVSPRVRVLEFIVGNKKQVAEGTTEMVLDTNGNSFAFKPGQYVRITLPQLSPDMSKGNTRDFTIVAAAEDEINGLTRAIRVAFRDSDSAFKKALLSYPPGTKVYVQGPLGVFTLPLDSQQPLVFVAGGMGITPFLTMLRFVEEHGLKHSIQLLYTFSDIGQAAYLTELKTMAEKLPNVTLVEKKNRVDTEFISKNVQFGPGTRWMLCGPPEMVTGTSSLLLNTLKVLETNISFEEYVGYGKSAGEYRVLAPTMAKFEGTQNILSEDLIKPILDAVGQSALVAITDVQGSILYVNEKFIEVSKYSFEELMGQNHRILKSGFHPPEFYQELWQTISSGKIWRGEIKNKDKEGAYYWVDTSISPIYDKNGKISKYIAIRFLITDKKILEEKAKNYTQDLELRVKERTVELEEEKQKLLLEKNKISTIVESIGDGVFVVDSDYKIIVFNKEASRLTQFTTQEVMGQVYTSIMRFMSEKDGATQDNFVRQAMEKGITGSMAKDTVLIRKDGSKLSVADSVAPLKNESGQVIGSVVVFRDSTKEREIDRMKTEFLSVAAHQLKTPLGSMRWNLEALVEDGEDLDPEMKETIQDISASNIRIIDLVNDLLNVSRIDQGRVANEPKPTSVNQVIDESLGELGHAIKQKQLKLVYQKDQQFPSIILDPKHLREVIQNLLSNAIKYNRPQGTVWIENKVVGGGMEIKISDTGIGIPKQDLTKLFSKFYRASNASQSQTDGSGLGLFVVKKYIEDWGGV